jgi:hypothetical protein
MKERILRDKQWALGVASLALTSGLLPFGSFKMFRDPSITQPLQEV